MENEICRIMNPNMVSYNPVELCEQIVRDYSRINHKKTGHTVGEVYELCLEWKYGENTAKELSAESKAGTEAAFELLHLYHSRLMDDVEIREWQERVNRIGKKYSRSTVRKTA